MAFTMSTAIPAGLRAARAVNVCRYISPSKSNSALIGLVNRDDGCVWPLAECLTSTTDSVSATISAAANAGDMLGVIRNWGKLCEMDEDVFSVSKQAESLDNVKLLAPLRPPRNVICVGKNYVTHVNEVASFVGSGSKSGNPTAPIIFTKAPDCVIGTDEPIRIPKISSSIDYEGEVALVLGESGSVFGVACLNDVTARDIQRKHQQWFLGKSCDTFCPLGPWITLADAVDWESGLQVVTRVNGEERQRGDGKQLLFSPKILLDTISGGTTLIAGDVIATGTPAGVGAGFDPPRWLKSGDVVEIEVEGVGILRNTVE